MKKSIQPVLVPVDENNIKDYLAFEKEYESSLKEYQSRIHPYNYSEFSRLIAQKQIVWYYIEAGGRFIGSVWLEKTLPDADFATLGIFIYDSGLRGRGFGEHAVRAAFQNAGALGVSRIRLHVRSNSPRAIACYKKCGSKEKGRFTRNSIEAIGMELEL